MKDQTRDRGAVVTWVLGSIVGLALLAGIVVGGYQLNWWLRGQEVSRSARINQDSYGRQNALTEAVLRQQTELSNPNLPPAQRKAIIAEMCHNAALLTGSIPLPLSTQQLIAKECP